MLYESGENYLETIYNLSQVKPRVMAVDIARELEFSKPSVFRAMKVLEEQGLIINEPRNIRLTEAGKKKAAEVTLRHKIITRFFEAHGVSLETAQKDACRVEHYISAETFKCIEKFVRRAAGDIAILT